MKAKKPKTPKFRVGERWYVKLPGATAVSSAQIIDRTPKVVELIVGPYSISNLYEIADLKFIEQIEPPVEQRR